MSHIINVCSSTNCCNSNSKIAKLTLQIAASVTVFFWSFQITRLKKQQKQQKKNLKI